ncbi:hypothetical protein SLA2020_097220 [Shorea laevis]
MKKLLVFEVKEFASFCGGQVSVNSLGMPIQGSFRRVKLLLTFKMDCEMQALEEAEVERMSMIRWATPDASCLEKTKYSGNWVQAIEQLHLL